MRPHGLIGAALLATLAVVAAGAARAADMPREGSVRPHRRVFYEPRYPVPVPIAVPRYRVIYQVPSDECAANDFCSAAF